jgi:uncharacterized membrane protein
MADAGEPVDARDAMAGQPARIRFERDEVEFGRAINFFDATFAIATTLLVTTLASGQKQWASWSAFHAAVGGPMFAYALSFVVVSTFWWANHRFVSSLEALTPKVIAASMLMLAFVVLVPFSTAGLGTSGGANGQVATVVYAINVAGVSLSVFVTFRVALAQRLFIVAPTKEQILERSIATLDVPAVFLASVPIALFWDADYAKYFWIVLIPAGAVERRWFERRRRARAGRDENEELAR